MGINRDGGGDPQCWGRDPPLGDLGDVDGAVAAGRRQRHATLLGDVGGASARRRSLQRRLGRHGRRAVDGVVEVDGRIVGGARPPSVHQVADLETRPKTRLLIGQGRKRKNEDSPRRRRRRSKGRQRRHRPSIRRPQTQVSAGPTPSGR